MSVKTPHKYRCSLWAAYLLVHSTALFRRYKVLLFRSKRFHLFWPFSHCRGVEHVSSRGANLRSRALRKVKSTVNTIMFIQTETLKDEMKKAASFCVTVLSIWVTTRKSVLTKLVKKSIFPMRSGVANKAAVPKLHAHSVPSVSHWSMWEIKSLKPVCSPWRNCLSEEQETSDLFRRCRR